MPGRASRWCTSRSAPSSASPGRRSAARCCGWCCGCSGSTRCSAPWSSWPRWSPSRRSATSCARTPACSRRSGWGWPWATCPASGDRPAPVLRAAGAAHHRGAVHLHLGHRHPRLIASSGAADARPGRGPGAGGAAAGRALLSTSGTPLSWGERAFVGWMAPRGIVAAATASTFSARWSRMESVGRNDPAGDVPGHRRHRHLVRPDRAAASPPARQVTEGPSPEPEPVRQG